MLDDVRSAWVRAGERLEPFAGRLVTHETLGSTNDEAARLAGLGAAEGTIVVADAQTGGRGRSGRTWFSPPGAGLYVSLVLRPEAGAHGGESPRPASWTRLITLAAGVAVAEGVRSSTGLPVEIKWPNDIVMREATPVQKTNRFLRKVAGVLTEASATGAELQHVIVGIGINVRPAICPPELAGRITSLETEAGRRVDRGSVLVETLAALWARYGDLSAGREGEVLQRWRALAPTSEGAPVTYQRDGRVWQGTTAGVSEEGALGVRIEGGAVHWVVSGEVRWT